MSGMLAFSIYKNSDGTTYQMDGANISPDSLGYQPERILQPTGKGTEKKWTTKHVFEIRHSDATFHDNFIGDSDFENMSWRMAGVMMNRFILWYEDTKVNVVSEKAESDPEGDPFPYTLRMMSYGSAIGSGVSLLHAFAKAQGYTTAWADTDSSGVADGWVLKSSPTSNSFASGIQTVADGGTGRGIELDIVFPVSNIPVTYTMEQVSGRTNGSLIRILTRNFSDSIITNTNESIVEGATGRQAVTATTDAYIYSLTYDYITDGSTGTNTDFEIRLPAVRLNGSTEYVDG